jgi:UDP-GlcNAc:undecaprenyl-phosphate GlcNAc-1-phosphate transferase
MAAIVWLGVAAFALALILTPIFRWLFRLCGFVDKPDQARKIHSQPIPRAGGTAIAFSYVATFLIAQYGFGLVSPQLSLVWKVLPAASVMFAVGIIDDLWGLKPWQKLSGQLIACGLACYGGILILDLIGRHERAWWTIPITILWLLVCSNAFNLVDGLDGLAGGVGLFATLTILIAALLDGRVELAMATVVLAGCLLGFLRYNFAPATVFLGDSGSLVIGFVLGCYAIIWAQKSATLLGLAAPIMALSIPLLDVGLAVVRRFLRRQPIFTADRGHIHHRLLDRGMSPRQAALALYAICSFVAIFSLLYSRSHNNRVSSLIVLIFCAVAWMGIQYLGYAEFTLAGRLLFRGDLQRALKLQLDLHAFDRALMAVQTPESCVKLVLLNARQFGFKVVGMQIAGESFAESFGSHAHHWQARIAFDQGDFVELARDSDDLPASASSGPFLDALRVGLCEKLPAFQRARSAVASDSRATAW